MTSSTTNTRNGTEGIIPDLKFLGVDIGLKSGIVPASGFTVSTSGMPALSDGVVFIGTEGDGLVIERTISGVTTYTVPNKTTADGLGSNFVSAIFLDTDKTLWAGTFHPRDPSKGGLSVSRDFGKTWETFRMDGIYDPFERNRQVKQTGMRSNHVTSITRDSLTNKLLIGTDYGVLSAKVLTTNILPMSIEASQAINDSIEFASFTAYNGLGNDYINFVKVESVVVKTVRADEPPNRTIWWAGTRSGLSRSFDQGSTWQTFDTSYRPQDSAVTVAAAKEAVFVPENLRDPLPGVFDLFTHNADDSGTVSVDVNSPSRAIVNLTVPFRGAGTQAVASVNNNINILDTISEDENHLYARAGLILFMLLLTLVSGQDDPEGRNLALLFALLEALGANRVGDGTRNFELLPSPGGGGFPAAISQALSSSPNGTSNAQVDIFQVGTSPFFTLRQNSDTEFGTVIDTRSLPNGQNTLYVKIVDIFGNQKDLQPVTFNVNNPAPLVVPPIPEILEPKEGAVISGIFSVKILVRSTRDVLKVSFTDAPMPAAPEQFSAATLLIPPRLIAAPFGENMFESVYEYLYDTTSIPGRPKTLTAQMEDSVGPHLSPSRHVTIYNQLPQVTAIAVNGNMIWAGTWMHCGVALSEDGGRTWTFFTKELGTGLRSNEILSVATRRNEVWVGTSDGLHLSTDKGKTWRAFVIDDVPSNNIRTIAFQGSSIWIGTDAGIGLAKTTGLPFAKITMASNGLPSNMINHIYVDCDQKTIWASTNAGIAKTTDSGQNWRTFNTATSGLPSNMVNSVIRHAKKIYAATTNGLGISKNEGVEFVRVGSWPLGGNNIMCFRSDGPDLWIGTDNGLTKLDSNDKFITYRREGIFSGIGQQLSTTNIGLKDNTIYAMAQ